MYYIAFIIPAFFVFLLLEYWIASIKGKSNIFSFESSVSNISIGIAERLLNLFITGSFYGLYYYLYENFALVKIPNHWITWVSLLLATDFVWYWYHRLGHEINLFWGAHIVHHQSEEFNYTVSARITTLQAIIRNLFWCLLPLIGFHPATVTSILVIHGTYSFFTHTQLIGKLGWLEYIFITPSHHGVHHASNEKYLNKNYGDIFVFWDLLFGTFQREEEKPVYGLTHSLKSRSFLWQHFHYYMELLEACKRSGSVWKSIKIIFGKPEDLDQDIRPELEAKLLPQKSSPHYTLRFRAYLSVQLLGTLIGLFLFTLFFNYFSSVEITLIVLLILLTLINCGALMEQQHWIYNLEVVRVLLISSYLSYLQQSIGIFMVSLVVLLLIISSNSVERWYFKFVYDWNPDKKFD
ncbi:MAG TPA: sterol desaturase family protein [Cyclobacteriaceae bacterium]|jgi:sterol desaturase/sphingolipid hydroxylase (fatty acid hydroxylase superfamily)|nr:sterol desaturase family protein [Cyclobacteriaceae bacterium]